VLADSKHKKLEYFKYLAGLTESRAGQFIRSMDFHKFNTTSESELKKAWEAIDTDKNGTLDKQEVVKMVRLDSGFLFFLCSYLVSLTLVSFTPLSLSVYLSICLSVCLFVYLFVSIYTIYLSFLPLIRSHSSSCVLFLLRP
jgi:hypothetical protein